jgi:hypothetical protein
MFDRMSLWLCCAARTKPQDFKVPDFGTVRFTPQPDGTTIVVEPYPLSLDRLSLSVPANRIPAGSYASDEKYQRDFSTAPVDQLQWMLR